MNQKKILIIGGAGYIGSHVNKYLHSKGLETIVLDSLECGHKEFVKWGTFIEGNISDTNLLNSIFSQHDISCVMHFSAYAYIGESISFPLKYYSNNVENTINLLKAMKKMRIKQFVFSSSCATFGNPVYLPIDEKHPQNPINPYGRTKLMVEQILKDLEREWGLKSVCLRYFNAAGADPDGELGERHEPETHIIPLLIDAALGKRGPVTVFGTDWPTEDGTCIRDYIHIEDLAQAHHLSLEYLNTHPSQNFNLGNGKGYSIQELISCVEKVSGLAVPVNIGPRRVGDPAVLVGNAALAMQTLKWKPNFSTLESIIQTAWNWHSSKNE